MKTTRKKFTIKGVGEQGHIYIGRGYRYNLKLAPKSKWHNPYTLAKEHTNEERLEVIRLFKEYITKGEGKHLLNDLHELEGKIICCHCEENQDCHGDILINLLNK